MPSPSRRGVEHVGGYVGHDGAGATPPHRHALSKPEPRMPRRRASASPPRRGRARDALCGGARRRATCSSKSRSDGRLPRREEIWRTVDPDHQGGRDARDHEARTASSKSARCEGSPPPSYARTPRLRVLQGSIRARRRRSARRRGRSSSLSAPMRARRGEGGGFLRDVCVCVSRASRARRDPLEFYGFLSPKLEQLNMEIRSSPERSAPAVEEARRSCTSR